MTNPTIDELQDKESFELIAELNHKQIKEFVIHQLSEKSWLVRIFMIYQVLMLLLGTFTITRSIIFAFQNNIEPLYYAIAAFVFYPTQMADRIYRTARDLFNQVGDQGPYRLIGVGLSDITPDNTADLTGDLLDPDAIKRSKAERAADKIRSKFGHDAIVKGRALR